jgi:NagD protein
VVTSHGRVLIHEEVALPGAEGLIARLQEQERQFLVLPNNSIYTRRDLSARLSDVGPDVPEEQIWTPAAATAQFLSDNVAGRSV